MLDRKKIISKAYHDCMKEMYFKAQPSVDYDQLIDDVKSGKIGKDETIYTRYFLSVEEFRYILNKYIDAYNMKEKWKSNIEVLEEYFEKGGIKDKWIPGRIENGIHHTGHRGYENVAPLKEQLDIILNEYNLYDENMCDKLYDTVMNTIKNCKEFYRFDREESDFSCAIALGASPTSNPETVKEYWKSQGIDIDIEIRNPLLFWEQDYYGDMFEELMKNEYGENWKEYWEHEWKTSKGIHTV